MFMSGFHALKRCLGQDCRVTGNGFHKLIPWLGETVIGLNIELKMTENGVYPSFDRNIQRIKYDAAVKLVVYKLQIDSKRK